MTALMWLAWIVAQLTRTTPRPHAGVHASTDRAAWSWRYRGRHAANRKRDSR